MNKTSRIYIAGHKGFVGNNLHQKLYNDGYQNLITAEKSSLNLLHKIGVELFFREHRPEYVFICAAKVGGIKANIENQYTFLIDNLTIQNNLIDACIKYQTKKVLFLGSSCMYPKDYTQPLKEEYLLAAPLEPTNEGYSLAKICGLKLCEYANNKKLGNFISLMPPNLYGPKDNFKDDSSHVLSALIKKIYLAKKNKDISITIWGSPNTRREFLYIDDLSDGILWAIENYNESNFINIGTGEDISIECLANKIAHLLQYNGTIQFDNISPSGMKMKLLDSTKINNLGWKAKTSFDDGLEKTVRWFIEHEQDYTR